MTEESTPTLDLFKVFIQIKAATSRNKDRKNIFAYSVRICFSSIKFVRLARELCLFKISEQRYQYFNLESEKIKEIYLKRLQTPEPIKRAMSFYNTVHENWAQPSEACHLDYYFSYTWKGCILTLSFKPKSIFVWRWLTIAKIKLRSVKSGFRSI